MLSDRLFTPFRAPTDNDAHSPLVLGEKNWFTQQYDCLGRKCFEIRQSGEAGKPFLSYTTAYQAGEDRFYVKLDLWQTAENRLFIDCTVQPPAEMLTPARIGLTAVLPQYSEMSWYGQGPLETYPDRQRGGKMGAYHAMIEDQPMYIRPQEYGLHLKTRSLQLTGAGVSLRFDAACSMAMSALPFWLCHYSGGQRV